MAEAAADELKHELKQPADIATATVSLDWRAMRRAPDKEDPTQPGTHKYRVAVAASAESRKVVLHLPCQCSDSAGRHMLTFTAPARVRHVIVKWEVGVCPLTFPSEGEDAAPCVAAKTPAAAAPRSDAEEMPTAAVPPSKSPSSATGAKRGRPAADDEAVGRHVLVPATLWPDYNCGERDGFGWEARVVKVRKRDRAAKLTFLYATDASGRPYEDVYLPLAQLLALPGEEPLEDPSVEKSRR